MDLLFARAAGNGERTAILCAGESFSYARLLAASDGVAARLLAGRPDLAEARIAFLVPAGFDHVAVQWGIWRAGGIAVPLSLTHPPSELVHVVRDSGASLVVAADEAAAQVTAVARDAGVPLMPTSKAVVPGACPLPVLASGRRAMLVYTSGTTGKPKGAVWTHANLTVQAEILSAAWGWRPDDHLLHVLPLHHIHGIVNALTCALWNGAACEMLPGFDVQAVWRRFEQGGPTVFMAVPTIYSRLATAWEAEPDDRRRALSAAAARLRLMVSGSAALPIPLLERWQAITGHVLLERYGMTEIGMALSNPLAGERVPGAVGRPLPQVEVRLTDEGGGLVPEGRPGQLEVRGPSVFLEYWGLPEATAAAFRDGWFLTGDTAVAEGGVYRILGRTSVDILKTGGYKVSALEIEEALLRHPAIAECAVVGVPDPEWGEGVAAAVVVRGPLDLESLRAWGRERLAPEKLPTRLLAVRELPRNAMGKVTKAEVKRLLLREAGLG